MYTEYRKLPDPEFPTPGKKKETKANQNQIKTEVNANPTKLNRMSFDSDLNDNWSLIH